MAEQKYTITVTKAQAEIMQAALEMYARVGFGQIWSALDHIPVSKNGKRDTSGFVGREIVNQIEDILSPVVGLNLRNSSWGVGNQNASPGSDDAWSMHTVIRHRLSWDRAIAEGVVEDGGPRNWGKMMGVNFDEPHRYGDQPPAKIERAA